MQRNAIGLLIILLMSLAISTLGMLGIGVLGVKQAQIEQARFNQHFLDTLQNVVIETTDTLKRLNRAPNVTCNDEFLVFLRQIIFKSEYIKDIGYFEGDSIVCTTGLGILDEPLLAGKPDATTILGYELWMNAKIELFDEQYNALVTKRDRFNIINRFEDITIENHNQYLWELIYTKDEQDLFFSFMGTPGLFEQTQQATFNRSKLTSMTQTQCYENLGFCIVSVANVYATLTPQKVSLAVLGFFVLFIASYLLSSNLYNRYYSVEQRVKRGVKNKTFYCLFQPIVCLKTQKVIGCEALARFKDSNGELFPDEFIPIISKLNLTMPFTANLTRTSLSVLNAHNDIPTGFKVNFNVFPCDVTQHSVEQVIASQLNKGRFNICFEITESEAIDSFDAIGNIDKLRASGFRIAIDDFGTGYSNLSQLQQMNIDTLKIDRSFVMSLEDDAVKSTFVRHIAALAQELDLEIVAEGIETRRQHQKLTDLGITLGQGWLFGKPTTAKELAKLVQMQGNSAFY